MRHYSIIAICDAIARCTLFVCVTVAAIHFENWKILLLCLIGLLMSHSYETRYNDKEKQN